MTKKFEWEVANWCGARFAIAVESCSAAIFLCCHYKRVKTVRIPKWTYPSVPCSIIHAGGKIQFSNKRWEGDYELEPYGIIDSALRFRPRMYRRGLVCLSFHLKKHLPIGRGGMILTDDQDAAAWLRKARFDGRSEVPLAEDTFTMLGWNMYMSPEQSARGLQLFSIIKNTAPVDLPFESQGYPDLSKFQVYHK